MEWISYAYGKNHYEADPELRDLLRHFWPGAGDREAELLAWGAYMGREVYEAAYHIDQDAGPELVMHDLDGNRVDRVRLSPVQREVLKRLRPIVRPPYEGGAGTTTSPWATSWPTAGSTASSPSPTRWPTPSTSTPPGSPLGRSGSSTGRPLGPPG